MLYSPLYYVMKPTKNDITQTTQCYTFNYINICQMFIVIIPIILYYNPKYKLLKPRIYYVITPNILCYNDKRIML